MSKRVVIIGAGVIGVACAHYLSESGWTVTLVDRGRLGGGCSHANCGLVTPSHVLPLAEPGAVRRALKALFSRSSPFSIKPRLDPALWGWLLRFARRCRSECMMEAGRGIQAMLHSSMHEYRELIPRHDLQCEWEMRGLMFAYRDPAQFEAYSPTNELLSATFGEPAKRLAGEAAREMEPALKSGLAGAWYYESDAHMRADRLLRSWRALLESRGVTIVENSPFTGFSGNADVTAARTATGELPADAFVIATGAWTPQLNRSLGCRIPIQPGKGYSITTNRPATCPRIPLIFPETRVAVTPMQSGYRLGSLMEFAGYDDSLKPERLDLLRRGAEPYLTEPWGERVEEQWYGWRPMTYDSVPIIDRSPAHANVVIAAGHNMLGLSMAPGTGRLVAEMLDGRQPHVDPKPYSVRRF